MWEIVAALVIVAAGMLIAPWMRLWKARAKRERNAAGAPTRIRVRARGPRPFPRRWTWGSVDTGESPLVYRRWYAGGAPAPLVGLTLLGRHLGEAPYAQALVVVFRLRDAHGKRAELAVQEFEADLFESVLRGDGPPAGPRPRRRIPRGRLAAAGLAVLWLGAWAYLALAGTVHRTPVLTADDEGYCRVEWAARGRTYDAEIDCYSDRPGDPIDYLALPPPFRGEAVDVVTTRVVVPLFAAPFLLPLALYAASALRVRLRRRPASAAAQPAVVEQVPVAALEPYELRWSTIEPLVRQRAATEEWEVPHQPPRWARPFRERVPHAVVRSLPGLLFVPAFVLLMTALSGWTAVRTAWRWDADRARETTATVEVVDGMVAPVPWDVEVSFQAGGRTERLRVASLREPDVGDRVTVRYDPEAAAARLAGADDGVRRGVLLVALVCALVGLYLAWRLTALAQVLRALRGRLRLPPAQMRYVTVLGPLHEPWLLLFAADRDLRPRVAVPFAYLPELPLTGTVEVHGDPADGEPLVVRAGDAVLYPDGPAVELETAALRAVVTGDFLDNGPAEDDEDDEG